MGTGGGRRTVAHLGALGVVGALGLLAGATLLSGCGSGHGAGAAPTGSAAPTPATATPAPTGGSGDLTAYISDSGMPTMTAVDLRTGKERSVQLPFLGNSIALTPDGRTAYITSMGTAANGSAPGHQVVPVDLRTMTVGRPIPAGFGPIADVVTPDGRYLLVADMGKLQYLGGRSYSVVDATTLDVIATRTNTLVRSVDVGPGPGAVTVSPDGATAYVTVTGLPTHVDNRVIPVDLHTFRPGRPISVGPGPMAVSVAPGGRSLVVANTGWWLTPGHTVSLVDLATGRTTATVPVGPVPIAVGVTPDGAWAFTANSGYGMTPDGDSVTPIDLKTGTALPPIVVGPTPYAMALTPAGTTVWVTHGDRGSSVGVITAIDTATRAVGRSYPAGVDPSGIAIARAPGPGTP